VLGIHLIFVAHDWIGHADANGLLTAQLARAQHVETDAGNNVVNQSPKFSMVCVSEHSAGAMSAGPRHPRRSASRACGIRRRAGGYAALRIGAPATRSAVPSCFRQLHR
jgi:hypothetical protein